MNDRKGNRGQESYPISDPKNHRDHWLPKVPIPILSRTGPERNACRTEELPCEPPLQTRQVPPKCSRGKTGMNCSSGIRTVKGFLLGFLEHLCDFDELRYEFPVRLLPGPPHHLRKFCKLLLG